ncbi:unnamed protein product [Malassezia sympodialis ATCC 42132]|uniref:uncharacterized protein n=1 Tax=Malassezia sympodialis (strain ATCC 42132) TaxID=1230383 RepID=UPI0002C255B3|nr:uncharacterized protein MSY001_2879 [Malassezia sympodialis ATCC 42132]CCV00174.1 unnamed protein product [Malassezia sympodialis ATCC 42132]|eukprot:XP_018741381.1 uncharacterized protein MSY001_2879 [Malassezia sympodialis ATCC 42132]
MGWREKKLFVLLANSWPDSQSRDQKITSDPTGWWISEKLDGVRAIWDGKSLWSRNGRLWAAPSWFTNCSYLRTNEVLPVSIPLDGELWIDRGLFELTSSICRSKIFDTPGYPSKVVEDRWKRLENRFPMAPMHQGSHLKVCFLF